ncbi:hypothetical protein Tco_1448441 [Tanacetum coccineum]
MAFPRLQELAEDGTRRWPKPDRESMWVHYQMHRSRMGHTKTNRGLAATGTAGLVVGQCLGRGNTSIPVRGDYLIGLRVRSTIAVGLASGSVATRTIIVPEVIDDCMSPQCTDSSEDETNPHATHGIRSLTSKSLTKDDIGSSEFTIYEMMKGCYVWSVREEDSLLVINLSRKVVQYNLISKMLHDIFDCGSNQLDDNHDDDDDELLQQLEAEHNVYEFI